MTYEVRARGQVIAVYERQRDALARVRELVRQDPDLEPEIVDAGTGKPAEPAATQADREDLAKKIGF
jgi:hypothetical protein